MQKKKLKRYVNPGIIIMIFILIVLLLNTVAHPFDNRFSSNNLNDKKDYETIMISPKQSITQKISFMNKNISELTLLFQDSDDCKIAVSVSDSIHLNNKGSISNNRFKLNLPKKDTYVDSSLQVQIENLSDENIQIYVKSSGKKELNDFNNLVYDVKGYDTLYRKAVCIVLVILIIIFGCGLYWWNMVYNKKDIYRFANKLFDHLVRYKLHFVSLLLISIGSAFSIFKLLVDYQYLQLFHFINIFGFLFIFIILCWYIFFLINKYKNQLPQLFITLAIPICVFYILFLVPNGAPDEVAHFYKAYLTSTFDFRNPATVNVPLDYINVTKYNYFMLNNAVFIPNEYINSFIQVPVITYNFLLYVASGFGLFISRAVGMTTMGGYLIARLMNALLFIGVGYHSIKKAPFAKLPLMIYLLSPMMIQQCTSVSADCVVIITCLYAISYMMYLYAKETDIDWKDIFILSATFVIIVLTKYNYLPIYGLLLLSWNKLKKLNWEKIVFIIGIVLTTIFIAYVFKVVLTEPAIASKPVDTAISFSKQLKNIISNPIQFLGVIFNTIRHYWQFYFDTFIGATLSWLNLYVNRIALFGYITLLILSLFVNREETKLRKKDKGWMLFLVGLMILALFIIFYLTWTNVGAGIIEGIQGRYFIPFFLILIFIIVGQKKVLIDNFPIKCSYILIFMHIIVLFNIYRFFIMVNV
ncbi:MAG: DUF2142 domain-containing protein [Erysipelotrichaceae bacterium]|nr:DUF2142 domain-containing protein [Erysipelotrichaceae bacterium]